MKINIRETMNRWATPAIALLVVAIGGVVSYAQVEAPVDPAGTAPEAATTADAEDADDGKTEEIFTQGRDALLTGKYDEAIKLLAAAVTAEPSKTGYRLTLARAYRYAGKTKEGAVQLEEILKIAADHIEAGQTLAEIYTTQERFEDVVRVLKPLLEYRHDYPTYHMLAEAEYRLSNQKQARKYFEEAIKLNPNSASDNYQLGNIYLSENGFARAAESYQAAIRLGMDSPVLRYKLGSAYFNLRNYFGRVSYQTIQSGAGGTISGPFYLIEAVPGSKDRFLCAPEASAIYQIARAVDDGIEDRVDIHVLRGTIFLNARRFSQAYTIFEELGPRIPDEDKALFHYYFAQAAFGCGQYQRYLELLQEAIQLDPDSYQSTLVDAYLKVADQYNQEGDLDKYIELLGQAVVENPTSASLHLRLGDALAEADRNAEAVVQWRMVLDLQADHPKRLELLGRIQTAHMNLKPADEGDQDEEASNVPTPIVPGAPVDQAYQSRGANPQIYFSPTLQPTTPESLRPQPTTPFAVPQLPPGLNVNADSPAMPQAVTPAGIPATAVPYQTSDQQQQALSPYQAPNPPPQLEQPYDQPTLNMPPNSSDLIPAAQGNTAPNPGPNDWQPVPQAPSSAYPSIPPTPVQPTQQRPQTTSPTQEMIAPPADPMQPIPATPEAPALVQ